MLRGSYSAKIDDKGRLKIPNAFRALVDEQHGTSLYITSLSGDSVRVYPMAVWLAVEQRLARMPSTHPARLKFLDRVNFFGQVGELDSQGRMVVPSRLRDAAGMAGEVDVLGQVDYLEVWNHERLLAKLQREPFTDDDARALAEFGIEPSHEPVLVDEVVEWLSPRADGIDVDCTLGLGGHAAALLAAGAGRVIGLDRDDTALAEVERRGVDRDRLELVHSDYRDLATVLESRGIETVDGVVADLGVSSLQLGDPARGFSFRQAGPLDMRMDRSTGQTLGERLSEVDVDTLTDVIRRFGEERHAGRVARAILRTRDRDGLHSTGDLASAARSGAGGRGWQRIDPATRTFQGLRIWVNEELDGLEAFLETAIAKLSPGGRLAMIAFHSLEDRIVKHTFRRVAADELSGTRLLTRRPAGPSEDERARNPRSRSARLRVIERTA